MAIAIKSIPILKEKEAETFSKKVITNNANKHTINFSNQVDISNKILEKAKI